MNDSKPFTPTPLACTPGAAVRLLSKRANHMADECGLELMLLVPAVSGEGERQQVFDCLRRAADLLRHAGEVVERQAAEDWKRQWNGMTED